MRGDRSMRVIKCKARRANTCTGFSLIDVLVSVAVMAILISLLLPALVRTTESARRVRCASNIRQVGLALQTYSQDHRDAIPPATFVDFGVAPSTTASRAPDLDPSNMETWSNDTMFVRVQGTDIPTAVWDGLGYLYTDKYLDHSGVLYCPSHHGDHDFFVYRQAWVTGAGEIAGNYQYRVPAESSYLTELDSRTSIVADGMRTRTDYNHIQGNNFLRADFSVGWYSDIGGKIIQSLPETPRARVDRSDRVPAWEFFDAHVSDESY